MPLDDPHDRLVRFVDAYLIHAGFNVSSKTYHDEDGHCFSENDELNKKIIECLCLTFSPTALHIRSQSDRIAIHPDDGMAFYYEAKRSGKNGDISTEALPLATHMQHGRRGVLCLYCCHKQEYSHRGFWAHDVPSLSVLFIPTQRIEFLENWYRHILPDLFPNIPIVRCGPTSGSNDPFVVIDKSIVQTLPTWQELFEKERTRWLENPQGSFEHGRH